MGSNILATTTGSIAEIEKGAKGATERPRPWEDIPDGSAIESGTGDEQWIDIVLYGDNFYQCIRSFVKGNGVVPTNTIYFKPITDYKRLATGLFLARKAYIHNLGVDNILITDQGEGKGNILLQADKDGIKCKQGTFENVTVKGNVNSVTGYVGNFTIENGSIKYTSATKTCELCKDYIRYIDVTNNQSLYFGYGDSGVKAELITKDSNGNDMTCAIVSGEDDFNRKEVGVRATKSGYKSKLTPNELYLGDYFDNYVQIRVANDISNFGASRVHVPTIGIKCIADKNAGTLYLALGGIPSGKPTSAVLNHMLYEENGYLKIYKK